MDVKRCRQAFRSDSRGLGTGDLVPAEHPLVKRFPGFFEPVADYVSRLYPQYAAKPEPVPEDAPKVPTKKAAPTRRAAPRKPEAK